MPSTGKMYVLTYYDGNNNNANSNSNTADRKVMNSDVYQYTIQTDSTSPVCAYLSVCLALPPSFTY